MTRFVQIGQTVVLPDGSRPMRPHVRPRRMKYPADGSATYRRKLSGQRNQPDPGREDSEILATVAGLDLAPAEALTRQVAELKSEIEERGRQVAALGQKPPPPDRCLTEAGRATSARTDPGKEARREQPSPGPHA